MIVLIDQAQLGDSSALCGVDWGPSQSVFSQEVGWDQEHLKQLNSQVWNLNWNDWQGWGLTKPPSVYIVTAPSVVHSKLLNWQLVTEPVKAEADKSLKVKVGSLNVLLPPYSMNIFKPQEQPRLKQKRNQFHLLKEGVSL